jgi:CheY-like chemotaxis protein
VDDKPPTHGPVLVVDDDDEIRRAFADALVDEGYTVVTATDGQDALQKLAALGDVCMILLDLMMPVMNGHELLETLKRMGRLPRVPVIVVSAYGHLAPKVEGAAAFLTKPISLDTLLDTAARFC